VSVIALSLEELPALERDTLTRNIRLAEDLGARVLTVVDSDVIEGLSRVTSANNITDIVIGRPEPRRRALRRSILDRLLLRIDCVDIHVVSPYRETCEVPAVIEHIEQNRTTF